MENDLISRQSALDAIMELTEARRDWLSDASREITALNAAYCVIYDLPPVQPTADAVPVIRCKDCKFLRFTGTVWKCQNRLVMMLCEPNDYCSRAEREEK